MSWQLFIIGLGLVGIAYLYNKNVKDIKEELVIAGIISFIWVLLSGIYSYSDANYSIFAFNFFPFIAWTTGLVALREIYEMLAKKYRFVIAVIIYTVGIIALEYVGYNILKIQLATNYAGLFGYPLMHMPWWAQLYYLAIGPMYLAITDALGVK